MQKNQKFSDYLIFVDESGDHGLTSINPENPVFVLVFCIFKKIDYITIVKQVITKFKLDFWGHDLAILHNHEIRKSKQSNIAFDVVKMKLLGYPKCKGIGLKCYP